MPRLEWRTALRAIAGFLVGLAMWVFLTPAYDKAVADVLAKLVAWTNQEVST